MDYSLGVDLGTTFAAAAVQRSGRVETVGLGDRSTMVPSVVLVRSDGTVLTGDAAHRRAPVEPGGVAREFKRRLGDPTPLVLGGTPYSAAALLGHQLRAIVDKVAEIEGAAPSRLVLTHPANWGPYKRELFEQVPRFAGLDDALMVPEPVAAAAFYATHRAVDDGALVGVYDLGGGTFDATVLRKKAPGFQIVGAPEGIEGLGGIDIDEAVLAYVDQSQGGVLAGVDRTDPAVASALLRLRDDCVLAKEALSSDVEAIIPVLLPGVQSEVRLTRGELERLVRPMISATIESLRRALRGAGVEPADLSTVLLVGGTSRMPLVSAMVSAELGRPTAVDAHPKYAVCTGAALLGHRPAPAPVQVAAPARMAPPVPQAPPAPPPPARPAGPAFQPRPVPAPPPGLSRWSAEDKEGARKVGFAFFVTFSLVLLGLLAVIAALGLGR